MLFTSLIALVSSWPASRLPLTAQATPLASPVFRFIIWNVGQGLWTTLVVADSCYHFDAGGERAPWRLIVHRCKDRKNFFSFSHWDWDHINFATLASRRLSSACILNPPRGPSSQHKQEMLKALPLCAENEIASHLPLEEIDRISQPDRIQSSTRIKRLAPNDLSRVFDVAADILAPGDSTAREEKVWAQRLGFKARTIHLLVLGHHGSRTSTSQLLLRRLTDLRQAVASARKVRYGHPHSEVVTRLKSAGVALISTEEWGSVEFEVAQ